MANMVEGRSEHMDRAQLRERVAALKHDLGKYVAWTSANLDDALWEQPVGEPLLDALTGDLLRTRTRDGEPEPAWEVWDRLTGDMPRPLAEPELAAVEQAVATLEAAAPPLRARDVVGLEPIRTDIRAAQRQIRSELQRLHRRLLEE